MSKEESKSPVNWANLRKRAQAGEKLQSAAPTGFRMYGRMDRSKADEDK